MTSVRVEAKIGQEKYYTEVKAGNNLLITDEPLIREGAIRDLILLKYWLLPRLAARLQL